MSTLYKSIKRYEDSGLNAVYFEKEEISFATLLLRVERMAQYLGECGVREGDVVTVALPNLPQTVYLFYALDAIGAVQNILHPLSSYEKIRESMARVGSHFAVLLETAWQENAKEMRECGDTFFFVNPMYEVSFFARHLFYLKYKRAPHTKNIKHLEAYRRSSPVARVSDRDAHATSVYLHSGGTTAEPKIIELSDSAIECLSEKVEGILGASAEGKAMLAVLPTFHGFGLGMGIHAPLSHGAAASLMMKFNADKIIKWIDQGKINMIIGVPLLYRKLTEHPDFKSSRLDLLENCFVGGDNVPPALITEFDALMRECGSECRMLEGYGLTETVTVCSVNTRAASRAGSVGRALDGISITVRDEEMHPLPTGSVGEVYVTGDTLMNGYFADPNASSAAMIEIDGEIWVRTGDLGYLDEDGFLFLRGRKKRMFKISGMNVYPTEIEKIASDVDEVADAALEYFDSPTPHTVLFIKKRRGCQLSEQELGDAIYALLDGRVLKYSMPRAIRVLDSFPETKVGKIDHRALCEAYSDSAQN